MLSLKQQVEGAMALKLIEKDAKSMHEHPPQEPIAQVPGVACPDMPNTDSTKELRKNRLNAVTHACQNAAVEQASQRRRGLFERSLQADAQVSQDPFEIGQPIIANPQQQSARSFGQIQDHLAFRDIACGQANPREHSRQTNANVDLEAIKRLLLSMIPSVGGFSSKEPRALGTGKMADGQGKTIDNGHLGIIADLFVAQPHPQALFHRPQMGLRWLLSLSVLK